MQENELLNTRTDGPPNAGGVVGLFTTVAGYAADFISQREQGKTEVAKLQASQPVIRSTPPPATTQTLTPGVAAVSAQWIQGVSNRLVLAVAGVVAVLGLLLVIRRK